jgi:hypothetical protein
MKKENQITDYERKEGSWYEEGKVHSKKRSRVKEKERRMEGERK